MKGACPLPPIQKLNVSEYLTPKPNPPPGPPEPSGLRGKVLHMSDVHFDPRKLFKKDKCQSLTAFIRLFDWRRGYVR